MTNSKCEAKTRSGGKCQQPAGWGTDHPGEGRCKLHGGCVPGAPPGNKHAYKHGIYSQGLHEDEKGVWDQLELGSLDEEIKLLRIQLRRAVIAQRVVEEYQKRVAQGENENNVIKQLSEISEVSREYGQGAQGQVDIRKVTRNVKDYSVEIQRLTKLIAKLEMNRKELQGDQRDPEQTAEEIKQMVQQMEESVPYADG